MRIKLNADVLVLCTVCNSALDASWDGRRQVGLQPHDISVRPCETCLNNAGKRMKDSDVLGLCTGGVNFEWLAYLTEELGSLSKAVSEAYYRNGPWQRARQEAIQVATLALKIAEMVKAHEHAKAEVDRDGSDKPRNERGGAA